MSAENKRVLCVGLMCLDIVTICDGFPAEDSDERCVDQIWQRGGNASNSCTTLSLVGENPEFLGVITDSKEQMFLEKDMKAYGVHYEHCVMMKSLPTPSAVIISNVRNASRTILACHRTLPEVPVNHFTAINLEENKYKWIHFEGRPNVNAIKQMLSHIDRFNNDPSRLPIDRIRTSVELEKHRENLPDLFNMADVVFISKEYAKVQGCNDMVQAVEQLIHRCKPRATIICPWGEKGAAARSFEGHTVTSPCFPPDVLTDTLAAGDTFIGSTIAGLSRGLGLEAAITFGCRMAGAKCGVRGWSEMEKKTITIVNEVLKVPQID